MSKFLLIGSVAAMLYGDCVWGMGDDIDPWRGTSSSESDQFNAEPARSNANPKVRSRRNSTAFSHDAQTQTEQSWNGQTQANPQQLQENRFIKDNGYRQYLYVLSNNSKIGYATPTKIVTIAGDLKNWNDISEIRYANDVSCDKLENPKVILYRNKDNSCYIILRIGDNKYGVFYGLNERNVEIGRNSFAVYDVSEDVGSFTDGVKRLIYVDESGLYFVPANENPVEDVINSYQNEGKFNFEGSVIKVSAIDGSITWNGEPVTKENFFDNWVLKEIETQKQISKNGGKTVIEKVKETKQVLSTKQPGEKEVLRNFYPPMGNYIGMYWVGYERFSGWLNAYRGAEALAVINPTDKIWLSSFINKRSQLIKAKSKNGAEELVRDGTFTSILTSNSYFQKVYGAVAAQIVPAKNEQRLKLGLKPIIGATPESVSEMVSQNPTLFKNPDFVRKLKPAFKELEKDYEHNKESDMWILFEIVRNL